MATFSAQVVDLIGTFSDETALDTFITEGANQVIDAMPRPLLERIAEETSVTDGTTTSEGHKILYVLRNDGTIDQPCRQIPAYKRGRVQDSSDMEFATDTDPVYYIQDGKINIFPNGNGLMVSVPTYSQSSPLDASAISTITNFPDEYEYLVTTYAAIKALQQNMSGLLESDLSISASAPSAPSIGTVSYSAATNDNASSTAVSSVAVSSVSIADTSGNVPSYTKPSSGVNFSSGNNFNTLLGTNEDVELAQLELQKQQEMLRNHQTDIQNELNEFNKENTRYQAGVQAELAKHNSNLQRTLRQAQIDAADAQQEAAQTTDVDKFNKAQDQALALQNAAQTLQATIQNNDDIIQKFLADMNRYTALVNTEVQTYVQNFQNNAQKFQNAQAQQAKLQADYDKGIQLLRSA